jgi:tetratricopeptide (TPR) repeat protein
MTTLQTPVPQPESTVGPSADLENNGVPLSWYNVPEAVKRLLVQAANQWENTAISEQLMNRAIALAGDHPDVLISAYRYFFYKNNQSLALQVANRVLAQVRAVEQLPEDWEVLKGILRDRKDEVNIRLFLNAYAASGFVLARMGEYDLAKEITRRVSEIDDKQFGGAAVVLNVLEHPEEEEE